MTRFEVNIRIYNLSLSLIVKPMNNQFYHFKVETMSGGHHPMILKYQPGCHWIVEKATMKFFTQTYVRQLGALIQIKKPEWFI
jgi:hypothetical protein